MHSLTFFFPNKISKKKYRKKMIKKFNIKPYFNFMKSDEFPFLSAEWVLKFFIYLLTTKMKMAKD